MAASTEGTSDRGRCAPNWAFQYARSPGRSGSRARRTGRARRRAGRRATGRRRIDRRGPVRSPPGRWHRRAPATAAPAPGDAALGDERRGRRQPSADRSASSVDGRAVEPQRCVGIADRRRVVADGGFATARSTPTRTARDRPGSIRRSSATTTPIGPPLVDESMPEIRTTSRSSGGPKAGSARSPPGVARRPIRPVTPARASVARQHAGGDTHQVHRRVATEHDLGHAPNGDQPGQTMLWSSL